MHSICIVAISIGGVCSAGRILNSPQGLFFLWFQKKRVFVNRCLFGVCVMCGDGGGGDGGAFSYRTVTLTNVCFSTFVRCLQLPSFVNLSRFTIPDFLPKNWKSDLP